MGYMDHPTLTSLFSPEDRARVAVLQDALSPDALNAIRATPGSLYRPETWRRLGALGLFDLAIPSQGELTPRHAARAAAMLADCLRHDGRSDLDMAIYVQGLVAPQTLYFHADNTNARDLLHLAKGGHAVFCTGYTDADPARPTTAERCRGGYRLSGRKWLSVNMPAAQHAIVTFDCGQNRMVVPVRLSGPGIEVSRLEQISGHGLYEQGVLDLDDVFVPEAHVLSGGLRRLRVWNRVMSVSRLMNAISGARSLARLVDLVTVTLSDRPVPGGPLGAQPGFRHWVATARARAVMLEHAIVATMRMFADGQMDEAWAAGLKALAVHDAAALAAEARDFCGGGGTLAGCEIAQIAASLSYHKFSGGAEAQLMALYGTSLPRKAAGTAPEIAT